MALASHIVSGLGWIFAGLSAAGSIYTVMAAVLVLCFFDTERRPPKDDAEASASHETVSLLKPLNGEEAGLRQNLAAHFSQNLHNPLQIVFGVQRSDDPAADVARALMTHFPDIPSHLCVGDRAGIPNRKIANLIQMAPSASGAILVLSDSDIRPPPDHLSRVIAALDAPGVGVVTCPYVGAGEAGVWSELAGMGISYQFLPNVIAGVSLGMATPCMGSTIGLRRETLERVGGFEAFGAVLADDYALGAAVRGLGLTSVVAPSLVAHQCTETTLGALFRHELRWARTIKGVDPWGHVGSLLTHPLPLGLIAALLMRFAAPALIVLVIAVVARFLLAAAIDRSAGRRGRLLWLLPLRDVLSFTVFVGSFLGRAVEWRGKKFHVTTDGDLSPV